MIFDKPYDENRPRRMKATHITDSSMLRVLREVRMPGCGWALMTDIEAALWGVPEYAIIGKLVTMVKRGIIDGCTCGCRGDFTVVADEHLERCASGDELNAWSARVEAGRQRVYAKRAADPKHRAD